MASGRCLGSVTVTRIPSVKSAAEVNSHTRSPSRSEPAEELLGRRARNGNRVELATVAYKGRAWTGGTDVQRASKAKSAIGNRWDCCGDNAHTLGQQTSRRSLLSRRSA